MVKAQDDYDARRTVFLFLAVQDTNSVILFCQLADSNLDPSSRTKRLPWLFVLYD